jgi:hypothetical protein
MFCQSPSRALSLVFDRSRGLALGCCVCGCIGPKPTFADVSNDASAETATSSGSATEPMPDTGATPPPSDANANSPDAEQSSGTASGSSSGASSGSSIGASGSGNGSGSASGNASSGSGGDAATVADAGSGASSDGSCNYAAPIPCDSYPSGPYGVQACDTVDPSLPWTGYLPGASGPSDQSTVQMSDFFDCNGSKKINALLVIAVEPQDGPSMAEANYVPFWLASTPSTDAANWSEDGVVVLTLVMSSVNNTIARPMDAWNFRTSFGLGATYVVADPSMVFKSGIPGGLSNGLPANFLIDPRTMKVVKETHGSPQGVAADPDVDILAVMNKMSTH